jgi:hypothetical protein
VKKSKTDYSGGIAFIFFIGIIFGFCAYIANDWKSPSIVSEKYIGTVTALTATNSSVHYYAVVTDSGQTFLLSKNQPQPSWHIKVGDKVWIVDTILNGGRSKLHESWLAVFIDDPYYAKTYYKLED